MRFQGARELNVRAHLLVTGRVQGVYFRGATEREAKRYNVTGWVRNLSDGRVEVLLEGDKEAVEYVIEFCSRGPAGAHVRNVNIHWEKWVGEFTDFVITHES